MRRVYDYEDGRFVYDERYGRILDEHTYADKEKFRILGINPPQKTKWTDPYSYDPFIVWTGNVEETNNCVYSDRLYEWDYTKYRECIDTVRNDDPHQRFQNTNPEQAERFLSLYYDKQIKLTAIVEGCNVSNGYPYWIFYFK